MADVLTFSCLESFPILTVCRVVFRRDFVKHTESCKWFSPYARACLA